jgi:hypothetical protein
MSTIQPAFSAGLLSIIEIGGGGVTFPLSHYLACRPGADLQANDVLAQTLSRLGPYHHTMETGDNVQPLSLCDTAAPRVLRPAERVGFLSVGYK